MNASCKKLGKIALKATILSVAVSPVASAFCREPSAPMFKPEKPRAPHCVDTFTNTHDCEEHVIKGYSANLERYNYEVDDYIRELQAYVENAVSYAECEIDSLQ